MNTPNYGNLEAITEAWGPDEGIELEQHTWSRVHASIVNMQSDLARLMAENERYKIALQELVTLKEIKDRITDLVRKRFEMNTLEYAGLQLMKADYDTRKPIAWAEARATLKGEPK